MDIVRMDLIGINSDWYRSEANYCNFCGWEFIDGIKRMWADLSGLEFIWVENKIDRMVIVVEIKFAQMTDTWSGEN